jgi:plasmid maintenance system antidote protein VapI
MRLRNNIFAEAFKWLKKNWEGIKYQKDLAAKIGVSEDTITRIMRDQTEVTDDFLCKFN